MLFVPVRKPNLLLLITLFVGLGALFTGLAQAAPGAHGSPVSAQAQAEQRWHSIWGLDLARKLREWRPSIGVDNNAEGLTLARPFGKSGPSLQATSSLPDSVRRSLSAGGGHRFAASVGDSDLFLFIQKRW